MEYAKVEGHSYLIRDSKTNSIINVNKLDYEQYVFRRSSKVQENQKVQTIEEEVYSIKNDISEIKSLLKELLKQ